jgi:integration host factor subunit beta
MKKSDLIKHLAMKHKDINLSEVSYIVNNIFNFIGDSLAEDKRVELRKFGAFSLRDHKGQSYHFKNKDKSYKTADTKVVYFRASEDYKNIVNKLKG